MIDLLDGLFKALARLPEVLATLASRLSDLVVSTLREMADLLARLARNLADLVKAAWTRAIEMLHHLLRSMWHLASVLSVLVAIILPEAFFLEITDSAKLLSWRALGWSLAVIWVLGLLYGATQLFRAGEDKTTVKKPVGPGYFFFDFACGITVFVAVSIGRYQFRNPVLTGIASFCMIIDRHIPRIPVPW